MAECKEYIRCNETEKLQLMFKLMDRVPDQEGVNTMLSDLEEHIYASGIADMVESADVITQVPALTKPFAFNSDIYLAGFVCTLMLAMPEAKIWFL